MRGLGSRDIEGGRADEKEGEWGRLIGLESRNDRSQLHSFLLFLLFFFLSFFFPFRFNFVPPVSLPSFLPSSSSSYPFFFISFIPFLPIVLRIHFELLIVVGETIKVKIRNETNYKG